MAPHRQSPDEDELTMCHPLVASNPLRAVMEMATASGPLDLSELRLDLRNGSDGSTTNAEDDELTSLAWLQDRNLLKSIRAGAGGEDALSDSSPASSDYLDESSDCGTTGIIDGTIQLHHPSNIPYNPKVHVNAKPPYSFSCLIFMAIEDCPAKALPVKDIYSWILTHFPYFQNAPTGWKNSVRHNLSLNKCFRKVDKDKGQNIGKGSLWCIDPDYRPNLLQALRKTPYHPYHQLQMLASQPVPNSHSSQKPLPLGPRVNINIPNPELFPYLSKRLAASSLKDPEVDAAATMLALKNGPRILSSPILEEKRRKRFRNRLRTSTPGYQHKLKKYIPVITCSPSEDHTYSATSSPKNVRSESPNSSIDEPFEFNEPSNGEEISDSIEDGEESHHATDSNVSSYEEEFDSGEDEDWENIDNNENQAHEDDEDEQKKIVEGADALLNLAGIKTNRSPAKTSNRTSVTKEERHSDSEQR